jgi:hypothetical protein
MALKKQYQIFVDQMVKHGDERRAYKAAYPNAKNHDGIRKGCLRMSQNATIQLLIKEASDKIRNTATQEAIAELKDEIKGNILTRQQKLELLHSIATGQLEIPVKKPVWDQSQNKYVTIPLIELPDHNARMKAMEIDSKMTGDYAPDKWEVTKPIEVKNISSTPEVDYEKLPTEALKNLLLVGKKSDD